MAEWPSVALSEVADVTVGHVGPMATEYISSGVPFLRSQNVLPMRLDLREVKYVSRQFHERLSKSALRPGDVVIVRTGRPGSCAVIPGSLVEANCADLVVIRCGPHLDPGFLSYYVNALAGQHISAYTVGAVQQHFNVGAAKVMPVPLPPLPEQRRIAGILGAIDDKIELNWRLGETLETMAQALFEASFGASTTHPAASVLGDVADVIDCLHAKKPDRRDGGRPLLHLGNIGDDGLLDLSDAYLIDDRDYELWTSRVEARGGDCVITNVGRVGAVAQIPPGVSAALGRNMTAVRCRPNFPYPTFLLEALRSDAMRAEIERKTDAGTILSALNVRNIPRLQLPEFDRDRIEQYERVARPLRARMETALAENHALRKTRDALLPRLLSGAVPA